MGLRVKPAMTMAYVPPEFERPKNFTASTSASLIIIMSAIFILVSTQFSIALSELRVSRMHERFSGLYDIGVSSANAMTREINDDIPEMEIIREYMNSVDWEHIIEYRDGFFILTGDEFYSRYKEIAVRYLDTPQVNDFRITHDSGIEIHINIISEPMTIRRILPFTIIVTNDSQIPAAENPTIVTLGGELSWNTEPPIYILEPRFDVNEETLSGKGFDDFVVSLDTDFVPLELSLLYRR
jgi:hypothetical protein